MFHIEPSKLPVPIEATPPHHNHIIYYYIIKLYLYYLWYLWFMFTFNVCILKRTRQTRQLLRTLVVFAGFLRLVLGSLYWLERCDWWTGSMSNHQGFPYLQLADLRSALLPAGSAHDPEISETLHAGTVCQISILKTYVILNCTDILQIFIIYIYIYLCVHVTEMDGYIYMHSTS